MSTYIWTHVTRKSTAVTAMFRKMLSLFALFESTLRRSPRTVNAYYVDLRIFFTVYGSLSAAD